METFSSKVNTTDQAKGATSKQDIHLEGDNKCDRVQVRRTPEVCV